jgi:hypothetical protein
MPSYEIRVRSSEPIRASQAMHRAQMPTIGWPGAGFIRTSGGDWTIAEEFIVFVAAENIAHALERLDHVEANFDVVDPGRRVD